ncbi:hypothetical protein LSH36_68g01009 [Paralvinella palmiformis]|uniref:dihydrofolate reductase n=1 Tax=Paralvinella palmiformis TaxID=53620 RepID=A0AAD9NDC9_9ANNE|nr:hypothetical protein LSH36_68g01009 [Paralvinella palmiformis]
MPPVLNLVIAMCNNNGIGISGKLPWKLKNEMAHFKKLTSATTDPDKMNALIMGRKTWQSIPEKFRPLPNRVNVVISSSLSTVPNGVYVAKSFEDAVSILFRKPLSDSVERIFIIGGASVYEAAIGSSYSCRIYLTRILADIKCDTFMPTFSDFKQVESSELDSAVQKEDGYEYKYEVYEKLSKEVMVDTNPQRTFNVCVAVEQNFGFSYEGTLPWPIIKKDFKHYLWLTSRRHNQTKKVVNIKGRATYEDSKDLVELCRPGVTNIVVSSKYKICPEYVYEVVPSFEAALSLIQTPPLADQVESVWVMGGQHIYEEAVQSRLCHRIYLTQIFKKYKCDRFFPEFRSSGRFVKVSDPEIDDSIQEENGIKFQFQVYERMQG